MGKQLFEFLSLNRSVDLRCFPISYQNVHLGQIQPDKDTLCYLPNCHSSSKSDIKRLPCFHTSYHNCTTPIGTCPICQLPLERKIGYFGKYHNTLLLSPQILHKHFFQFLLGLTTVPRENQKNAYAKFGGTNK